MNTQATHSRSRLIWALLAMVSWPIAAYTQVAVPEIEELQEIPVISDTEIEELVGPIALYPDDLLAIVLPASTFPLQIVEAGRFLEALEDDPSLEPDEEWDDSIVALLNYPEVVELLNEDLDWTWRLGEAVVGQQSDVIASIEDFRDRAYAAGNLQSDDYQLVSQEGDTIQITPVQDDVIYVPYYEPEEVVVYQPRPVYYYHPRPYPVYYYPYPSYYSFHDHFHRSWFWGVTTAYSIGWHSYHVNTFHPTFYGHPYYGHSYWNNWWYRRPDIHVYNTIHVRRTVNVNYDRYRDGDRWAPRERRTVRSSDGQITRTRYYAGTRSQPSVNTNTRSVTNTNRSGQVARTTSVTRKDRDANRISERDPIQFRDRSSSGASPSISPTPRTSSSNSSRKSSTSYAPRPSTSRSASQKQPEPRYVAPSSSSKGSSSSSSRRSSQPKATPPPRSSSPSRSNSPSRSSSASPSRSKAPQASSPQRSSQRSSQSSNRSSKSSQSSSRSSSSRKGESSSSRRRR
jgi:hypothetical protein